MVIAKKRTRRALSDSDDDDRSPPPPPRRSSPDHPVLHVPAEHEFKEGPDVQIIGETDPLDNARDNDVPVRVLTDFAIYDNTSLHLVPVATLLQLAPDSDRFSAAGCVKAWIDNEDEDDDEDEEEEEDEDDDDDKDKEDAERENSRDPAVEDGIQRLELTPIKRFSFHDLKKCHRRLDRYLSSLPRNPVSPPTAISTSSLSMLGTSSTYPRHSTSLSIPAFGSSTASFTSSFPSPYLIQGPATMILFAPWMLLLPLMTTSQFASESLAGASQKMTSSPKTSYVCFLPRLLFFFTSCP